MSESPLKIKTLKAEAIYYDETEFDQAMIHLQHLETLVIEYTDHLDNPLSDPWWDHLSMEKIHLRSLSLPTTVIRTKSGRVSTLELYLTSYSGLEELTIANCRLSVMALGDQIFEPMEMVMCAHSSSLRKLRIMEPLEVVVDHSFLAEAQRLEWLGIAVDENPKRLDEILETVWSMWSMRTVWVDGSVENAEPVTLYVNRY